MSAAGNSAPAAGEATLEPANRVTWRAVLDHLTDCSACRGGHVACRVGRQLIEANRRVARSTS